jgi:hypothetical protein
MCEKRAARPCSASAGAMLYVGISRCKHSDTCGGGVARAVAPWMSQDYKRAAVMVGEEDLWPETLDSRRSKTLEWLQGFSTYAPRVLTDDGVFIDRSNSAPCSHCHSHTSTGSQ